MNSTYPTRGIRVRRTHLSRNLEDILLDRAEGTKQETGKLVQPGFHIGEYGAFYTKFSITTPELLVFL